MQTTRSPAVAGRFYPGDPASLQRAIERYLPTVTEPEPAIAVVAPHAGYMYSGAIAGETYARVQVPSRAIVLCPNHTGLGVRRSLWDQGAWQIPGAEVPVDEQLARGCMREAHLQADTRAHVREHAIEVHLPFLVARRADVRIVPLCLGGLSFEDCREVGEGIARSIRSVQQDADARALLVASTDMSHYVSADTARRLDRLAIERILSLDPAGLYAVVRKEDLSMCGYVPTTVTLVAALALGATNAQLVRYGNSGETSGDFDQVVGYAGFVIR